MFSSMYPRWLSYGCNTAAPDPLSLRHQLIERRAAARSCSSLGLLSNGMIV